MADAISIFIQSEDGNEVHGGGWSKEDPMKNHMFPRTNRQFDCTKTNSIHAFSSEALDRVRRDGRQHAKVGALR